MKKQILNIFTFAMAIVATVLYFSGLISAEAGLLLASTPPAAAGGISNQYISLQGIGLKEYYPELVRRFGDQGSTDFMGTMIALGWTAEKSVELIQHWEDDWVWSSFAVGAQAGGGATATLTVQPQSIDADGNFYPQVKDVIEFPTKDGNGNPIQAYVTAIGANTIDIKVMNAGATIPATTANQELIVVYNLSAEGTGQPAPKRSTYNEYTNTFGIVKTTTEFTGSAATTDYWFESANGKPSGAVNQATFELDYRQLVAEQGLLLTGIQPTNITDGGKPVKGTKALFSEMNTNSIQAPYTTWGQSNFDLINKSLSRVYAGATTGMMMGLDLYTTNENQLIDFNKQTGIDMTTKEQNMSLFGEEGGVAVTVNFKYYRKTERTYAFKMLNAMNHPQIYGADGYDYTQKGWAFPLKSNNTDVKSKAKIPTICTVYKAKGTYNRAKEMFTTGSADVEKYGNTNDVDNRVLNCRSEIGIELFASNQFVNIKPA